MEYPRHQHVAYRQVLYFLDNYVASGNLRKQNTAGGLAPIRTIIMQPAWSGHGTHKVCPHAGGDHKVTINITALRDTVMQSSVVHLATQNPELEKGIGSLKSQTCTGAWLLT